MAVIASPPHVPPIGRAFDNPFGDHITGFTPFDLNPITWFDASDSSTITEAGLGISAMTNKAAGGDDLIQATDANRPSYDSGNNKIDFDGTEWLAGNPPTINGDFTYFIVGNITNVSVNRGTISASNTGTNPAWRARMSTNSKSFVLTNQGGGFEVNESVDSISFGTQEIWSVAVDLGTDVSFYEDGVLLGTPDANTRTSIQNPTDDFTWGASQNTGSEPYLGDMSEVLIFNRLLTASEQNQIGNYLAAKYALTWTTVV